MKFQFARLIATIHREGDEVISPRMIVEHFSLSAENARLRGTVEGLRQVVAHRKRLMVLAWMAGMVMGAGGAWVALWAIGGLK